MPETGHSVFGLAAGARRHAGIPGSAEENEKRRGFGQKSGTMEADEKREYGEHDPGGQVPAAGHAPVDLRAGGGGRMARRKITSMPGWFGGTDHYDENGKKIGYSLPGLFGGTDHYNADGSPAGYSLDGVLGGTDHFDADGRQVGYSLDGVFGTSDHFDETGSSVGYSTPNLSGGSTYHDTEGVDHADLFGGSDGDGSGYNPFGDD